MQPAPTRDAVEAPLWALLDRVEDVWPIEVARARDELEVTLAGLRSSAVGPLAFGASCLTATRWPVEVAFSSDAAELRTTVDPLTPEADRTAAISVAERLAVGRGATGLPARTAALLHDHQRGMPLRFGAWLGSRHTASASADKPASAHKLYVEVDPERVWSVLDELAPDAGRVLGGAGPVRLVGLALDGSDGIEVYVRPPRTNDDLVRAVLGRAGLAEAADGMCRALAGTGRALGARGAGRDPGGRGLDGRNHGLGVACAGGAVVAVAGFTFAHQRFRRDHRVREQVLAAARAEGWTSGEAYAAASAPLRHPLRLRRPVHTLLSDVAVRGRATLIHHVGLAPPPGDDSGSGPAPDTMRTRREP